jgi:hypothetical protein
MKKKIAEYELTIQKLSKKSTNLQTNKKTKTKKRNVFQKLNSDLKKRPNDDKQNQAASSKKLNQNNSNEYYEDSDDDIENIGSDEEEMNCNNELTKDREQKTTNEKQGTKKDNQDKEKYAYAIKIKGVDRGLYALPSARINEIYKHKGECVDIEEHFFNRQNDYLYLFTNDSSSYINDKFLDLFDFITKNKIDIICLNETYLNENSKTEFTNLKNFTIIRNDRMNKGGGIAILIRNGIQHKTTQKESTNQHEFIEITIGNKDFKIIAAYTKPQSNTNFQFLQNLIRNSENSIILFTLFYINIC